MVVGLREGKKNGKKEQFEKERLIPCVRPTLSDYAKKQVVHAMQAGRIPNKIGMKPPKKRDKRM